MQTLDKETRIGDRRRLSSMVAQEICTWIIEGRLNAGDLLPSEAEMCSQFNVSKPTLREAIDKLSTMGIVRVQQGKQTSVNPLNSQVLEGFFRYAAQLYPEALVDMLEMRRGIETEAAARAARGISTEAGDRLLELAQRMRIAAYSPAEYLSADFEFHQTLVQASGNQMILQTFNGMAEHVRYTQRICHMQRDMRNPEHTLKLHLDIAKAVISGDTERIRPLMFEHFENMMPFAAAIIRDKSRQADIF